MTAPHDELVWAPGYFAVLPDADRTDLRRTPIAWPTTIVEKSFT